MCLIFHAVAAQKECLPSPPSPREHTEMSLISFPEGQEWDRVTDGAVTPANAKHSNFLDFTFAYRNDDWEVWLFELSLLIIKLLES